MKLITFCPHTLILLLANSKFLTNSMVSFKVLDAAGGAIQRSSPVGSSTISKCEFSGNSAGQAGGSIYEQQVSAQLLWYFV